MTLGVLNYWSCSSFSVCCLLVPPPRLCSVPVALETSFREVLLALPSARLMPAEGLSVFISPTTMSRPCPSSHPVVLELPQFDSGLTPSPAAVLPGRKTLRDSPDFLFAVGALLVVVRDLVVKNDI